MIRLTVAIAYIVFLIIGVSAVIWQYLDQTGPPDVFFLGMPKAGTTSLHAYLTESVGMCGGIEKEYHYFEYHHTGLESYEEYKKNFQWCKPGQVTMDGSPSNSGYEARENIYHTYTKKELKTKKFILILREPIDRMYSWFNFQRAKAAESCSESNANCDIYKAEYNHLDSFKEYYEFNKYYGVKEGSYYDKVMKLLYNITASAKNYKAFPLIPRENMFIVNFDTVKKAPEDTLMRMVSFLGLTATNYTMPYVNDISSQMQDAHLKEIRMKCKDYFHYKPIFEEKNVGLVDFINNHPKKPKDEPYFPEFKDKFAERCSNAFENEEEAEAEAKSHHGRRLHYKAN